MKIILDRVHASSFLADVDTIDPKTGMYKDPLMHWPLRGAAFTNEVGEALRPLIGSYATLSWAPAFLYIGADVYDKYKNEQTEYSPNSRRALKQAIFQGLASILLPIVAVKGGQSLFSLFGYMTEERLSLNTKDRINDLATAFVANGNMRAYKNNNEECINKFKDIVLNSLDYHNKKDSGYNKINRIFLALEEKFFKKYYDKKNNNIEKYTQTTITELIELRKNLLNPTLEVKKSKYYTELTKKMEKGQTLNVAVKSVLNKYIKDKGLKNKVIKTIGGFLMLGVAIKPIDTFVEEVLIGKVISPSLEKKLDRTLLSRGVN